MHKRRMAAMLSVGWIRPHPPRCYRWRAVLSRRHACAFQQQCDLVQAVDQVDGQGVARAQAPVLHKHDVAPQATPHAMYTPAAAAEPAAFHFPTHFSNKLPITNAVAGAAHPSTTGAPVDVVAPAASAGAGAAARDDTAAGPSSLQSPAQPAPMRVSGTVDLTDSHSDMDAAPAPLSNHTSDMQRKRARSATAAGAGKPALEALVPEQTALAPQPGGRGTRARPSVELPPVVKVQSAGAIARQLYAEYFDPSATSWLTFLVHTGVVCAGGIGVVEPGPVFAAKVAMTEDSQRVYTLVFDPSQRVFGFTSPSMDGCIQTPRMAGETNWKSMRLVDAETAEVGPPIRELLAVYKDVPQEELPIKPVKDGEQDKNDLKRNALKAAEVADLASMPHWLQCAPACVKH